MGIKRDFTKFTISLSDGVLSGLNVKAICKIWSNMNIISQGETHEFIQKQIYI